MADICSYNVLVKGKKEDCYRFFEEMIYMGEKGITAESGTDSDYTVYFYGFCKWAVSDLEKNSKAFNVEVWCNSYSDGDPDLSQLAEHYNSGKLVGYECPGELRFDLEQEEDFEEENDYEESESEIPPVPQTLEECEKMFDCYVSEGRVCISNIVSSASEIIVPGEIDGMPVEIASFSFDNVKGLKRLVLSEGIVKIGADAFQNCRKLKEVIFASTIEEIGSGCFAGTPWEKSSGDWVIVNGILISYSGEEQHVTVPNGVTKINMYAFFSNKHIESLVISESVSYIGEDAFSFCENLKHIQFPKHRIEFGAHPFSSTAWADSQNDWVVRDGTLLEITDDYYYSNLISSNAITIPDGVNTIGDDAFQSFIQDYTNVKTIYLPETLKIIGDRAFSGFSGLERIELPSSLLKIGERAFENCTSLTEIAIPNTVETIGRYAFTNCLSLAEISLPDTVKTIGRGAFTYDINIRSLIMPRKLDVIPDAFAHSCSNLEILEMPRECHIIEDAAFESCSKLTDVIIPYGVEEMGSRAFYGCIDLQGLNLPDTVKRFGWATFKRCDAIVSIVIPEGVTELPDELFLHCNSLEKVAVPRSVVSIGDRAFDECPKLTLIVQSGSYAEKYASENKLRYEFEAK